MASPLVTSTCRRSGCLATTSSLRASHRLLPLPPPPLSHRLAPTLLAATTTARRGYAYVDEQPLAEAVAASHPSRQQRLRRRQQQSNQPSSPSPSSSIDAPAASAPSSAASSPSSHNSPNTSSTSQQQQRDVGDAAASEHASSSSSLSSSSSSSSSSYSFANQTPQMRRAMLEVKKERKLNQYAEALQRKAKEQGTTVDELRQRAQLRASALLAAAQAPTPSSAPQAASDIERRDAQVAAQIRERAAAEAKRKLESGELASGLAGSKTGVKSLADLLDLDRLASERADKVSQIWTGYHSMKDKLSSVVPTSLYETMVEQAREYPQFVLPLPRTIVGGDEGVEAGGSAEAGAGNENDDARQGYEMYFLEWGVLPPPPPPPNVVASGSSDGDVTASATTTTPALPSPTTVLFTPLAEYKLRQEYAQPLLVLTFYTDLARSHGVVLMRGDVTGADEAQAAPTGLAAAEAARARGASDDEVAKLAQPLQTRSARGGARLGQQDAQLLAVTLQRFYMPTVARDAATASEDPGSSSPPRSASTADAETISSAKGASQATSTTTAPQPRPELSPTDAAAHERRELLHAFHRDPQRFDLAKLCKAALTLS